jgi:Tol biopolymer transport system component
MIVSASEKSADTLEMPQLWLVSPDGQAKAITNGLAGYQGLSATRDGSLIMSSEIRRATDLWLLPNNDSSRAQAVTTSGEISGGFTAAPDGRIVTGSRVTGNVDLWIMNQDGSGRKQLTHEGGRQPAVSPNNKYIVFHSERGDGKTRLYRMDMDGQNIRQLTNGPNNVHPRFSGDGRWVYYLNFVQGKQTTIAKVPIDGGESTVQVTPPDGWEFTMLDLNRSDGRIACALLKRDPNGPRVYKIGIVPADGRTVAQMIDLPSDLGSNVRWMPDGRSLATIGMHQAIEVWRVPITGKVRPSKLTDFRTPATYNYNWTVDGKSMLVSRATNTSVPVLIRNAAN